MAFEWTCDKCGSTVADGDGWITLDMTAVAQHEEQRVENKERYPGPIYSGAALLDYLEPVAWHVYHRTCDPDPDGASYFFDVDRCHEVADLLDWWLHLSGKRWFKFTDWPTFIRRRVMPQCAEAGT